MRAGSSFAALLLCLVWAVPARADDTADWAAYNALQKVVGPIRAADPKQAAAHYTEFFNARPNTGATVGAKMCGELARLHYAAKDLKLATEVLDWCMQRYPKHPGLVAALAARGAIFLQEGRAEEVEPLFEQNWDLLTFSRTDSAMDAILPWTQALDKLGKKEQVPGVMQRLLLTCPSLLDEWEQWRQGWLYDRLQERLVDANRTDEALQFAKLRFMLCRSDAAAVERSTKMLAGAFMAKDPSRRLMTAFQESQADPAKPNPLADVKLPEVKPEALKAQIAKLQGDYLMHHRITVLLLAGDFVPAMADARRYMVRQPDKPEGPAEICRIFKAADLNLKRANAFASFVKTGEGPNPLDEFLKGH